MASRSSELKRVREARRFYRRPPNDLANTRDTLGIPVSGVSTSAVSSPNKTLTALMQLIACRLGMQRAMVSVVDENEQYFLAESTRTLDLNDPSKHDAGDDLWAGCGGTSRGEALCANTIELPSESDSYACFSVLDLSKDVRFCNLPYVVGSPNFRYYSGTPLLTRENVPIGSVFVMDDRPRGPPTKFEIDFLGVMARNVMEYLEMRRESETRKKLEVMSQGMAAFLEAKFSISPLWRADTFAEKELNQLKVNKGTHSAPPVEATLPITDDSAANPAPPNTQNGRRDSHDTNVELENLPGNDMSSHQNTSFPKIPQEIPTKDQILSRAANLLRESLDVNYTVFLDVSVEPSTTSEEVFGDESTDGNVSGLQEEQELAPPPTNMKEEMTGSPMKESFITGTRFPRIRKHAQIPAKVLSLSTEDYSSLNDNVLRETNAFRPPYYIYLRRLFKKYPEGKLWSFSDTGVESLVEDHLPLNPASNSTSTSTQSHSKTLLEAKYLLNCFPGVKQLLFAPLIDVESAVPLAACFAISLNPISDLSAEVEGAFLRGFLNSVSMACSRASMAAADSQKGKFISSMSHELRSPLHGILASVELMTGTTLDTHQKELCTTISTCGQTLLEIITGILEFTKINTIRSDARSLAKKLSPKTSTQSLTRRNIHAPGMIVEASASSSADLRTVCEDAVTIVAAAYMYNVSTEDQSFNHGFPRPKSAIQLDRDKIPKPPSVIIVLNITPGDWNFTMLTGSFQRLIMNLVANSLKYTRSGFIKVDLSARKAHHEKKGQSKDYYDSIIELHVIDSGRGISEDYLKTKLFSAFAQESTLAPGTGLGLFNVKGLVELQNGTIDIESEVGKGTHVTVRLPLRKPVTDVTSQGLMPILASTADNFVSMVVESPKPKDFAFYGFGNNTPDLIKNSLHQYLVHWLHMSSVHNEQEAAIVIVDEEALSECLSAVSNYRRKPGVIVVRTQLRQQAIPTSYAESDVPLEILTIPFGPNKLSKAIFACLEPTPRIKVVNDRVTSNENLNVGEIVPPVFESPLSKGGASHPNMKDEAVFTKVPIRTLHEATTQQRKARILCVDDNAINLRILRMFMEKLNFRDVAFAENGSQAFDLVRYDRKGFDVIFMDLSMPICDGFKCTSSIRSLEKTQLKIISPNAPLPPSALIVALTGLASQRDQDAARAAGADHFLTKPLKLSRLRELLADWGID